MGLSATIKQNESGGGNGCGCGPQKGVCVLGAAIHLFLMFHLRLQSLLCLVHKAVAFFGAT